MPTAARRNLQ